MKTLFIGRPEVDAYLTDLVHRLDPLPEVWCPITKSGRDIALELARVLAQLRSPLPKIRILPIETGPEGQPRFDPLDGDEPVEKTIPGARVLLIDAAIHSGWTMANCLSSVVAYKPASLASYALIVKRRSVMIPTVWGVMTDETDRVYFMLDRIPNNRLNSGPKRTQPHVHLRRLEEHHVKLPPIVCTLASINRVTWADRLWEMKTSGGATTTYMLECGTELVGFITLNSDANTDRSAMTISEVVVSPAHAEKGYGGLLLRFADTMARQRECEAVRLHAIENKVTLYKKFGYERVNGSQELHLDDEVYVPMERTVLYHHQSEFNGA